MHAGRRGHEYGLEFAVSGAGIGQEPPTPCWSSNAGAYHAPTRQLKAAPTSLKRCAMTIVGLPITIAPLLYRD
jgi:hypothetical protein